MKNPTMYNVNGANTAQISVPDYRSDVNYLDGIIPTRIKGRTPTVIRTVKIPTHKGAKRGTPYTKMNGSIRRRKYG